MQEVDTLVQYVISPIWTYFANLKSEKWNLATIFLFLLILFQDVSWHALKIYFDMIWITKKKYNLIIKNPWTIFLTNFYIFLKYFPLCYTPILGSILIVMVTMKIARYNAKAKFNFWSHQSARDTEQDERIFCPNSLLHNGIKCFLNFLHVFSKLFLMSLRMCTCTFKPQIMFVLNFLDFFDPLKTLQWH